jgi:predicted  nucleic acid-binding Zn-ribbon protein
MNLVGKIFVVLILVMSLVFMTIAMMTYAMHRNWRDAVLGNAAKGEAGLKEKLQTAETRLKDMEAARQRLETENANVKSSRERAVAALETERDTATKENARLNTKINELNKYLADATNTMGMTQETLKKLREQMAVLQEQTDTARLERDNMFKEVVKLTDDVAQATGELSRLDQTNKKLAADNAAFSLALQDANIQLDRTGPPRVEGIILASRASGLVEISLGYDDGLEKGHALDVYRQGPSQAENKYLGKIEVVETQADRAVARVLPNFRKGTIQKEDRVSTRLQ